MFLHPNKHEDPLRMYFPPTDRRCPFDLQGVDRSKVNHDGFDFNPDRWLTKCDGVADRSNVGLPDLDLASLKFVDEKLAFKQRVNAHMPFGTGPRACVGRGLAMNELLVFLAELLRNYTVQVLELPKAIKTLAFTPEPVPDFRIRLLKK